MAVGKAQAQQSDSSEPYDLDAALAESTWEPFPFRHDGKTWQLPHFRTLTPRQALAMERGDFAEALESAADNDGLKVADVLLDLPGYAAEQLIRAWMAHAGLRQGESGASTRR